MEIGTNKVQLKRDSKYLYIAILFMTFYTAPLFSYSPVRFSDIGAVILLYMGFRRKRTIGLNPLNLMFLCLGIWAIADIFIIPFFFNDFDVTNYLFQLFRLEVAILVFLYFPSILKTLPYETIIDIIKKVVLTHAVIQIIYVVLYYLGIDIFHYINTFDERLSLISENYLFTNHFIILNVESGRPRFSGFFEEPAWFGWTMSLMLSIILQACLHFKRRFLSHRDWGIIIVSYVFTLSLSAMLQLLVICISYLFFLHKKNLWKLLLILIIVVGLILLYLMANPSIVDRLILVSEGGDGSSSSRLIGSWNALVTTLNIQPWIGFGLGDTNTALFLDYAETNNLHKGIFIGDIYLATIHNIIVQIICSLGIIGGFFFLLPFVRFFNKRSMIVALAFILVFFSVNVYNTFFFFTMSSLAFYLFGTKRYLMV